MTHVETPGRRFLSDADRQRVRARVTAAESRVGAQIVTAVVAKSDVYPEVPWKAFALATALASLAVIGAGALRPRWPAPGDAWLLLAIVLGAGLLAAASTVLVPALARGLLSGLRAEVEVHQHAQGFFLDHELFRTRSRTGVLVLVSLFERRVVVLPDRGLAADVPGSEWAAVVKAMTPLLATGRIADALVEGVGRVEAVLLAHGTARAASGPGELPDEPIEERTP